MHRFKIDDDYIILLTSDFKFCGSKQPLGIDICAHRNVFRDMNEYEIIAAVRKWIKMVVEPSYKKNYNRHDLRDIRIDGCVIDPNGNMRLYTSHF